LTSNKLRVSSKKMKKQKISDKDFFRMLKSIRKPPIKSSGAGAHEDKRKKIQTKDQRRIERHGLEENAQ